MVLLLLLLLVLVLLLVLLLVLVMGGAGGRREDGRGPEDTRHHMSEKTRVAKERQVFLQLVPHPNCDLGSVGGLSG